MEPISDENEGLRSPKAIAFIQSKCSRNSNRLRTKTYSIVRTSPKATEFFNKTNRVENRLNVPLMKNLGDKIWIK
jgi:hypothetical protein